MTMNGTSCSLFSIICPKFTVSAFSLYNSCEIYITVPQSHSYFLGFVSLELGGGREPKWGM